MGMAPRAGRADAHARSLGFPDYATMIAWHRKRSESLRGPARSTTPAEQNQPNFLQSIMGPVYPPMLLRLIGQRYAQATGQDQ